MPRAKKGAPTSPRYIQPVTKYTGWLGCLLHLHREFGRLERDDESLNHYQQQILSDLRDQWSEASLSSVYDWWRYDIEALRKRKYGPEPAFPRIELRFWINVRRNFILEWQPADIVLGSPGKGCDWEELV